MKQGILFDLDGTLWDSSEQVIPAWNAVLSRRGQPTITPDDMAGFMGKTLETIAGLALPHLPLDKALEVLRECCAEENVRLRRCGGRLYPDVETTLQALQTKYHLSIVSNCGTEYMDAFFAAHGLGNYFADYETHGGTGLTKAENIRLVVSRNRLDRAVYVGDTELDRQSAEAAGIPFIYAAYGFGKVTESAYTIERFAELGDMVASLSFERSLL